ncbi:MAG: monovalent cation/H+ antiporter subunit D family protein [Candidatus Firestonebacteria bacterium]|nr:monovalent cation/H+ antiporter subunit D family protein [Candidatus Firestonebacteria bacterium]
MNNLLDILFLKNFSPHFILFIVFIPFIAAMICLVAGFFLKKFYKEIGIISLFITFILSLILALKILYFGEIIYIPGDWHGLWRIEFVADYMNALITVLISGLSLVIMIYSIKYIPNIITNTGRAILHYPLFLFIVGAMEGFILAGDLFTMFMFLSTFSLSGYTLVVSSGDKNSVIAGIKYLYMGAIASVFFLHGIAFIYAAFGTLNIKLLSHHLQNWDGNLISAVGLVLLIMAFSLKTALFPLHTWLPDAHSYAPSSVSAILSGLVVEMGTFGIIRVIYYVYGFKNIASNFSMGDALLLLSTFAIFIGAFGAMIQDNIKTVLAYSTISQMGYIVIGIGLGTHYGMIGSILHIINHAIMKASLFLCAGCFIHAAKTQSIEKLRGIGKKMPYTFGAFMLAGISIIGFPPTAGFISKWYLCLGAVEAKKTFFAVVILLGSILSAIYYIKLFNKLYFDPRETPDYEEAPKSMLIPVWTLAVLSLVLGLAVNIPLLWIEKAVAQII